MKYLIYAFCAVLISACGSGGGGSSPSNNSTSSTGSTNCPAGNWFSTNGYSDYVAMGIDGRITLQFKSGATSNGYASCSGNQLTMNIVAGGQKTNYCTGVPLVCGDHYVSQGVGVYSCSVSLSGSMFQIFCPDKTDLEGNLFNPSRTYWSY